MPDAEKDATRSLTIWCSSCLPGRPCFIHDPVDHSPPAEKDAGRIDLPCPVCKGEQSHHAACSVPVLGLPSRCTCSPAEVENGECALCGKPFPVGGSV